MYDTKDEPIALRSILNRIDDTKYVSRQMTRFELTQSIQDGLRKLLSTINIRLNNNEKRLNNNHLTILDFGIPSFTDLDGHNPQHQQKISEILKKSIQAFEPRLADLDIKVRASDSDYDQLDIMINANLVIGKHKEDFYFLHRIQ